MRAPIIREVDQLPEWARSCHYEQMGGLSEIEWFSEIYVRAVAKDAFRRWQETGDPIQQRRYSMLIDELRHRPIGRHISPLDADHPALPLPSPAVQPLEVWEALLASDTLNEEQKREIRDDLEDAGHYALHDCARKPVSLAKTELYLSVDLTASDELMEQQVKRLVQQASEDRGIQVRKRRTKGRKQAQFERQDFANWAEFRILHYFDLAQWAEENGVEITDDVYADAIFPDQEKWGDSIRKTVIDLAPEIINLDTASSLTLQILNSAPKQ